MQILTEVSEDDIWEEVFFDLFKYFLHWGTDVGEKTVAKRFHHNRFVPCTAEEGIRAALGFFCALQVGTEHEPIELEFLRLLNHPQDSATAADLDVVTVRPQAQHPLHAMQGALNHFLISS